MNKGLTKDVWLYFNNEADNDDMAASTNGCWPAKDLINMRPALDGTLELAFKSMKNAFTNGGSEEIIHDTVTLNIPANTHLTTMQAIVQAVNNTRPNFGGFIDVADDHTIIIGGGAGSRTSATGITFPGASILARSGITSCATIVTGAVNTGVHNGAITATADGGLTGNIPHGGFYTVTTDNADKIVTLPAPVPGTKVILATQAEGQAFELRSSAPATIGINGGTASNGEAAIAATATSVVCTCINATNWFCHFTAADGTIAETDPAA